MYIPIVTGAYKPRHANSPTPFYHKLALPKLEQYRETFRWSNLKKGLNLSRIAADNDVRNTVNQ